MLTRNFDNIMRMMLETAPVDSKSYVGWLPAIQADGTTCFLQNNPASFFLSQNVTPRFTLDATTYGISVGSGTRPAAKTDFNLENTIASGISGTITTIEKGYDTPGVPWVKYTVTITNTGTDTISVSEIGIKKEGTGTATTLCAYPSGTSNASVSAILLIDRTVISPAVVIQPGNAGVIEYKLYTEAEPKTKAGVNLVDFTWGSDEDIAAMIDAAHRGDIDLQADGNWSLGDYHTIHINEFTCANNVVVPEQDIDIAITGFGDYNNCGSVIQFDFAQCLSTSVRMNSTATNVGGYKETEMYNTNLPALVDALPTWLKSRLITFDVLCGTGGGSSSVIETVSNNKLALRSLVEIYGDSYQYDTPGEGQQLDYYKLSIKTYRKTAGRGVTSSTARYNTRSPSTQNATYYLHINTDVTAANADQKMNFAPFGCL